MAYEQFFPPEILSRTIPGFPYAERFCRFCDQPCTMVKAVHLQDAPEHYKALFICENPLCECYDEDARSQYARVYYSSDEAFHSLELHRIYHPIKRKD